MNRQKYLIFVAFVSVMIGFICGYVWKGKGIPFMSKRAEYSIGILHGESPFNLVSPDTIKNPVITAKSVTDVKANFVADPFMILDNSIWYMFFEVMNANSKHGDIGLAISGDGSNWTYKKIVLDESFHLSYPYVFKWENEYYMIPESYQSYSIRLYKAVKFPTQWSFIGTLLSGRNYMDSSILFYNDMCWIFTTDRNDYLRLYYSRSLIGSPWIEHPKSPIVEGDANIARPGGRLLLFEGRIFRFAQDDEPSYGNKVRAFEIINLTTLNYKEFELPESPVLEASGYGWNGYKMHHIDPHQIDKNKWIACVDGYGQNVSFGLHY